MLAYNRQTLDNLEIKEEAEKALRKDCIDAATFKAIEAAHPVNFYTPNPIIKIGLFILTVIIASFSMGFLTLISLEAIRNESGYAGLCVFFGLVCYGALELFIREKKFYKAGVDDALLWSAIGLFLCALAIKGNTSLSTWSICVLVLTLLATLRFADMALSGVAYLAFLAFVFSILVKLGPVAKTITPFVIMLLSLATWFVVRRLATQQPLRHYKHCLTVVEVLSLLTLYLAGNYFVVREVSNAMFDLQLKDGQSIPGAMLFWIFTTVIPFVYLYLGIRRKDAVLLRTGMLLLAAIVFTIRYYHSVMPLETAMVTGGIILTGGAWALISYLQTPRHGFTYLETDEPSLADKLNVESLVIAQTFKPGPQTPSNDMNFGGGTGGGGGASGEY
ncbi:hypothetical protein CLV51_102631 [Chitinophaga niastensis]|uniref:Membrane protein DUF2157 n=1 Tax=Chitinophaga niastensis TaxID=536980 RepID=A0A2P8HNI4_CHINA|nr:hypothetical protein [Chitinophaga niastensis]PSL47771.1 hypothetical protein CLV51_102631 [Chitinophaga niastensis]